jgi:hypothetical protein
MSDVVQKSGSGKINKYSLEHVVLGDLNRRISFEILQQDEQAFHLINNRITVS